MIARRMLGIDVVEAARQRVIESFSYGKLVRLSFSGGKDSIVLAHIVLELVKEGKINKDQLIVTFIDEEAMFDEVIDIVKLWRRLFMEEGVKFEWYCIQVKHYNCLNSMSEDESFICWDQEKKDVWVRPMPPFAITDDPFLIPYKDTYQDFFARKDSTCGIISMRGVRVSESVQRLKNMARLRSSDVSVPIYDMKDQDIWLYIKIHNLDYPKVYENLYRIGRSKKEMRISQFFSIDTAKSLVNLGEMYPDLMERVQRREPNAYICALYWDTEMFGRNTRRRKELEKNEEPKDYKALVVDMINHPEKCKYPELCKVFRNIILRGSGVLIESDWRRIYECMLRGDPKKRFVRAIIADLGSRRKDL